MKDIVITLPAKIKWEDYEKELQAVEDFSEEMYFKVPSIPKDSGKGAHCYLVWRGKIRGYMLITGFYNGEFVCSTTGNKWSGKFIKRSGPFHEIEPIEMKGFMGWRYFSD